MTGAELLSAVAASVAAVLSGVTLWLTSRREERRWRREALVDTIVEFLDASFNLPGNKAYLLRQSGGELAEVREKARAAEPKVSASLSRLRVLASSVVVEKAEALGDLDGLITEILLSDGSLPSVAEWHSLADKRMRARTELLDTARRSLGLGVSKAIGPGRHRPSP